MPGPRSRAILERKERAVASPAVDPFADRRGGGARRDAHRRRRQRVHRLHRRRRLPERRPLLTARGRGRAGAGERFTHTDFTIVPYETYVDARRATRRAGADLGRGARRVLQLGRRGGRERRQDRACRHRPPGGHRLRRRLPRPHAAGDDAHLEDAPVQGGLRAVRAGGLPRPVRRTRTAGPDASEPRSRRSSRLQDARGRAEQVAAIVFEPVQGEGGFVVPPAEFVRGLRRICDEHGIVLVADEVQTGFGRTGKLFAIEHFGVEPDLIDVAKSIAGGLPLSGVLGRAEIMDAPGRERHRRHLRRQPGRVRGGPRRARRVRGGGAARARRGGRRRDPRADGAAGARRPRRSATCAASARCSRSNSCATARRRSRRPRYATAIVRGRRRARTTPAQGRRLRKLHPRARAALDRGRPSLDEALDVWEESLQITLA